MRFTASLKYLLAFRSPLCPAAAHVAATTARAEKEGADGRFQKIGLPLTLAFYLIDWLQFQ